MNLRMAVVDALGRGWHNETWRLAHALRGFYRRCSELDDWLATHEHALAAAQALENPIAEVRIRESLGAAFSEMGKPEQACVQWTATLATLTELGDDIGIGRSHHSLGTAYARLGQLELAITHKLAAMAIPAYAAHPQYAAYSAHSLGVSYGELGRYDEALQAFQRTLAVAKQFGDAEFICLAEHNLAELFLLRGDCALAQTHARQEIHVAQHVRYSLRQARGWDILGECLISEDYAMACEAWQRALEIYQSLDHPFAVNVRDRIAGVDPHRHGSRGPAGTGPFRRPR